MEEEDDDNSLLTNFVKIMLGRKMWLSDHIFVFLVMQSDGDFLL